MHLLLRQCTSELNPPMIKFLFVFFISFFSSSVFATGYKAPTLSTIFSDGQSACTAFAHIYGSTFYGTFTPGVANGDFDCIVYFDYGSFLTKVDIIGGYACPFPLIDSPDNLSCQSSSPVVTPSLPPSVPPDELGGSSNVCPISSNEPVPITGINRCWLW